MKRSISTFILLLSLSFITIAAAPETIKIFLNGIEVTEKISLTSTGKLEIRLPEGWRYISGKVKILHSDEVKKSQQIVGENGLKEFDLLQFIKQNAASGDYISFELSVRTRESSTLSTMKFTIE